jgi:iron complex outermembrane receptor protein
VRFFIFEEIKLKSTESSSNWQTVLLITLLLCFVSSGVYGQETESVLLRGQALDETTGNPVADVNIVLIENETIGTATDLSGRFRFELLSLSQGNSLRFSHMNYEDKVVEVSADVEPIKVELKPKLMHLSDVVITANRKVSSQTPGAISGLNRETLELAYGAQDVPQVVAETPSVNAFSWSGSDVGASQMSIRGFDTERLSVSVNGVPVNDPEDHAVYWQDTPDFLTNTYDLQVERGVSDFTTGPAGVAGGLSLATADAISKPELSFSLQAGSFNTLRRTLSHRTGLINEKLNFTARLSQVSTDGYRDHTGAEMWAYFFSGTLYGAKSILKLQTYGGKEEMDASWWGVDKYTLENNRTANYSAWYEDYHEEYFWDPVVDYGNEGDVFEQPHYVLNHEWRLSPATQLHQTVFYIEGDGYYEEYKPGRKFTEYNLVDDLKNDSEGDGKTNLIRRKYVDKEQIGWMPHLSKDLSTKMKLGLGLELRSFEADHWGKVIWAEELRTPEIDRIWYQYEGSKTYKGGYANLGYELKKGLNLTGGLQYRSIIHNVNQDSMGAFKGYNYEVKYTFINPRFGISYDVNDKTNIYASFAGAGREPVDDQIFDGDNPYDIPNVEDYKDEIEALGVSFKEIKAEQMLDAEIGGKTKLGFINLGMNIYAMFFTDEIVQTGFSSVTDKPVYDNAPTSQHMGVELEAGWTGQVKGLSVNANLSYGQATLGDYEIEYTWHDDDWNYFTDIVNLKGNRIARFPDLIGNLRVTYTYNIYTASLQTHHVGKQYMDNRENDDTALDPYTLLNGVIRINLPSFYSGLHFDLELRGSNLLDTEYEPYGIVDVEDGTPYYVPAAGRTWLAGLTLRM